jgi:hypothetical protein
MASDQLDAARQEFEESRRRLPDGTFPLLDRLATCGGIDLDLYAHNPEGARDRLDEAWPRLAPMCRLWQNGRIELLFYRARIALALAAETKDDSVRDNQLKRAQQDARDLHNEARWADALAVLVDATIAQTRGDRDGTLALLLKAEKLLETCHMKHYVAAARYRRGALVGGDEGRSLIGGATEWLHSHHMVNETKIVNLLAPGAWSRAGTSS